MTTTAPNPILDAWASWLAEDDGIPVAVQPCFDMSQYYAEAREILEVLG